MRNTKKVISILLTLLMVVGMMSTFAFAEGGYSITINDSRPDRTYEAYQILTGDSVKDTSIGNVKWGSNVTPADGKVSIGGELYTAAQFAKYLNDNKDDIKSIAHDIASAITGTASQTVNAKTGDAYVLDLNGENQGLGYYLVKETGDAGKYDEFSDFIISVVGNATANPKIAGDKKIPTIKKTPETQSVSVGKDATFELTATLPENLDDYSTYKLVFNDTMTEGLTYKATSAAVYLDTTSAAITTAEAGINISGENQTLTVTINNVKAISGVTKDSKIIVQYKATVTKAATSAHNIAATNTVYLNYSNDPKDLTKVGKTDPVTVNVTNGSIAFNKVDGTNDNAPLAGAGFTLYEDAACTIPVKEVKTGVTNTDEKGYIGKTGDIENVFNFTGLAKGTYYIKETITPDGFNTLKEALTVTIKDDYTYDISGITPKEDTDGNKIYNVENNKGTELPSTGGIGTTIFYLIGAILVIGAGVVFVTRRRMHSEK